MRDLAWQADTPGTDCPMLASIHGMRAVGR